MSPNKSISKHCHLLQIKKHANPHYKRDCNKISKKLFLLAILIPSYQTTKKRNISVSLFFIKYNKNYTLISTSTPLGNSNFIRASIVFDEEE